MFGDRFSIKKETHASAPQIPYQIYETVHHGASQRRRWTIRLLVALLAATLLVVGISMVNKGARQAATSDGISSQSPVQQAPQTKSPTVGQPVKTPLSDTTSDQTVGQPQ